MWTIIIIHDAPTEEFLMALLGTSGIQIKCSMCPLGTLSGKIATGSFDTGHLTQ